MKSKILVIALAMVYTLSSYAGEEKIGTAGFSFLKVPIGAREVSMGQTGLTSTSGASAIYWNPANIANEANASFSFSYLSHFAGISENYGALAFPISDMGVIGFSLNYLSYGDVERTTERTPEGGIGNYAPFEMALGFSYSKQVTDRVSTGMTVKYINSSIDKVSASAMAFDFGFTYNTDFRGLKLGFVVNNLGPQAAYTGDGLGNLALVDPVTGATSNVSYESELFNLPASVSIGASMDLFRNEQNSVNGVFEQNINSFQANRTNVGVEYGFQNQFFARGGYTSSLKKDLNYTGSGSAGMTFGAGMNYKFNDAFGMTIDYGFLNMGDLGGTHRFSVGMKF